MRPVKSNEGGAVRLADGEVLVVLTAQDIENIKQGLTVGAAKLNEVYRLRPGEPSRIDVAHHLARAAGMGVLANEFYSADFSSTET